MAPQLERVASRCHPVLSGGGFDSLTNKHEFAARLTDQDRPTEVLAITDLDPPARTSSWRRWRTSRRSPACWVAR